MKLTDYPSACRDYERIEKAIMYIETNFDRQPELKEISDHIGLSEFHFQRLFSNWVGISPKRFLQFLTKEYVKALLDNSANLLDADLRCRPVQPRSAARPLCCLRGGNARRVQGPAARGSPFPTASTAAPSANA